jgi:carbon-monoxide dehydrogenase large subunit
VTAGGGSSEFASVRIEPDGGATISVGTSAHGQGHATSFAQIVNAQLGIPIDRIGFVQSDTDLVPRGGGTGGSRSLQVGGTAVHRASEQLLDTARRLASHLLEASTDDIVVNDDGSLGVTGAPGARTVAWAELYDAASRGDVPSGLSATSGSEVADQVLAAAVDVAQSAPTFPFGAHVSVVEVDMETGEARVLRHVAVDDCGMVVNPMLVAGQQHGGIAAGVGQALFEQVVYDEDGNPLTGTLVDYAIPTAAELPSFEVASQETPTPLNPLGAKGIGEAGTIGATPAVQNAVIDAVSHLGVRHIDMPCTPERVWQAIAAASNGGAPDPWREPPAIFSTIDRTPPASAEESVEI